MKAEPKVSKKSVIEKTTRDQLIQIAAHNLANIPGDDESLGDLHAMNMVYLNLILVSLDRNRDQDFFNPTTALSDTATLTLVQEFVEPAFFGWLEKATKEFETGMRSLDNRVEWWKSCISDLSNELQGFSVIAAG